jgi:transcription antitermination protein NusB
MGARTSGREAALQMLFGLEATSDDVEHAVAAYWREVGGDAEAREYADRAVRGVMGSRDALDELIRAASEHWRLERMTRVDRNLLRLGTWEIMTLPDVPRAVVLDEAIELAKRFGTEDSGAFVNGVLNQIAEKLGRHDADR